MADKIDQLTVLNQQGVSTSYDIDLPADATPSIVSITTSGNANIGGSISEGGTTLSEKYQEILTSGENIKTINGLSILGDGDISISGSGTAGTGIDITNNVISIDANVVALKTDISDMVTVGTSQTITGAKTFTSPSFKVDITSSNRNVNYTFRAPTSSYTGAKTVATTDEIPTAVSDLTDDIGILTGVEVNS